MAATPEWRSADPERKLEMLRADAEFLQDKVETFVKSSNASQEKTDDLLKKIAKAVDTIEMRLNALELRL